VQTLILIFFLSYTALLFFVSWLTSKNANNDAYFPEFITFI